MGKTPRYILLPKMPYSIKSVIPDAKIIFSLRDPVRRAFSHYQMLTRKGGSFPDLSSKEKYKFVTERGLSSEDCVAQALQKSGVVTVAETDKGMNNHTDEDFNEVEENVKEGRDAGTFFIIMILIAHLSMILTLTFIPYHSLIQVL